jgi:hypothetical protein
MTDEEQEAHRKHKQHMQELEQLLAAERMVSELIELAASWVNVADGFLRTVESGIISTERGKMLAQSKGETYFKVASELAKVLEKRHNIG